MEISLSKSIESACDIFEAINLLEERNLGVFHPPNYAKELRGKTYQEQWQTYIQKYWFHMLLTDGSLLLFQKNSFRFLMAPIKSPSKEDFLHEAFGNEWSEFSAQDQNEYLSSSLFQTDFQNFVDTMSRYGAVTPVRYDMSLEQDHYCHLTHPAFHLHIGFENDSRIPVKLELTPLSFSLFILSTFYPKFWEKSINDGLVNDSLVSTCKTNLKVINHINSSLWSDNYEERRLYLG